ncbi:hypothetical protein [Natronoglomus mannanivorans]|uniref:Uncharacterized protein n=1 Tax=Natronoglomus mannanivorans TaxID=2979990 RepID=A0AAP3E361_9EURY|nr:hypothetical protein [Halobacteria archaeon AArc-xg1-1]
MRQNTINRTVSVMPADVLFIHWTTSLNAPGLFREALVEQTSDLEDLEELLESPNAEPPQYE